MSTPPADGSGVWLASQVWNLLEEKYGSGKVPSVRKLTQHIRDANGGEKISHGHVHNILNGDANNITDKTRKMLATFFGVSPSRFVPAAGPPVEEPGPESVEALAFRFSTLRPEELAAIEKALRMVKGEGDRQDRREAP
ncbi:hypothetical protein SAMN05421810_11435 [Amycolatopsis arida]|uniref:HTH cro/C1-type domain-containing protein n=1 Tax=Amycolatopsis arida TaxID=587909 RepID=A0A1I6ARG7_9PSEU|nr:hypothetical protein [Amycolatopsis arida]TDX97588.1 hypothetical protein CLV69_102692 [Amycolatopsis arida]SFQ71265.1 hypothetical protein SAMN05421810_11435 [Amycolatopsis arida]